MSSAENESNDDRSFASIHKPHESDDQDALILLWGRFWSDSEDTAGAFYTNFNLGQNKIGQQRIALFEDPDSLDSYDPDQSPLEFRDGLPDEPQTGPNIPRADLQIFNQSINQILQDREQLNDLQTMLSDKNRDAFGDWAYNFLSKIVKKGDLTYQVKGQLSTREVLERTEPSNRSEPDEDEEEEETEETDRNYLPVTIATSPMNGEFPRDVANGEVIYVRATGPIVEKLPEDMLDERYDHASVQLDATVTDTDPQPELPADFDGAPDDYWKINVSFLENKFGEGYIHKDEQVKLVNPETEEATDTHWLLSPAVMISTGVILLGMVGLAYFIFGG